MSASDLSDESLLRYYNSIRRQVEADRDSKHKFMGGDTIKEYAESLRLELYKRRLPYTAIDWSADQQTDTPSKSDVPSRRLSTKRCAGADHFDAIDWPASHFVIKYADN